MKKRWIAFIALILLMSVLPLVLAKFVLPYAIIKPYKPPTSHIQLATNIQVEKLKIEVAENLQLALRLFHPKDIEAKGAVILLHGIGSCKEHQYSLAEELADRGWYAVAYDARAHGESEGEFCSFGYFEKHDVLKIKDLLISKIGQDLPIGIWGHSMGGAVAVQALALDPSLAFGIILSPFSQLDEIVLDRMERYSYIRNKTYADYVLAKAGEIAQFDPAQVQPSISARHIKQPIFMAHGSADKAIIPSHGQKVFKNLASTNKEFYLVEGAGHNNLFDVGKEAFREKLFSFLEDQEGGKRL